MLINNHQSQFPSEGMCADMCAGMCVGMCVDMFVFEVFVVELEATLEIGKLKVRWPISGIRLQNKSLNCD